MKTIDQLPAELLMKIFSYLDTNINVLLVNKLFYGIACAVDGKVNLRINAQMDSQLLHGLRASYRNISKLEIMGPSMKHFMQDDRQPITAAVKQFSASLRNLIISKVTLDMPTFLEILSFAPNIKHLGLCDVYFCADVGLSKRRHVSGSLGGIDLMNLKSLSISGCDDEFVGAFEHLSDGVLSDLVIGGFQWNGLTAILNRQLNIKSLKLGMIRGDGDGDTTVFDKLTLESLVVRGDKMSTIGAASILSKQTTLKLLTFQSAFEADKHVLNAFTNQMELEVLSMRLGKIPEGSLKNIEKLKKLKDLTFVESRITNDICRELAQCKGTSIAKLTFDGYVHMINTDTIDAMECSWRHLKHLTILETELSLATIMSHFNFVEVLDIGTDNVKLFVQNAQIYFKPRVKELTIRSRNDVCIKATGLSKLSSFCRNLTKLVLATSVSGGCGRHIEIKPILDTWPNLESLTLCYRDLTLIVVDWDFLVQHKTNLKFMSVGRLAEYALSCHVPTKLKQNFGVVEQRYGCIDAAIDQNAMDRNRVGKIYCRNWHEEKGNLMRC